MYCVCLFAGTLKTSVPAAEASTEFNAVKELFERLLASRVAWEREAAKFESMQGALSEVGPRFLVFIFLPLGSCYSLACGDWCHGA